MSGWSAEIAADTAHVARPAQPRRQPEHRDRRARLANLVADRPGLVNAADHRLESRRQMADQVEDHFLRAADHERVREIHDAARGPASRGVRPVERHRPLASRRRARRAVAIQARGRMRVDVGDKIARLDLLGERRPGHRLDGPPPAIALIARAMSTSGVPTPLPTLYIRPVLAGRLRHAQERGDRIVDVDVVALLTAVAVDDVSVRQRCAWWIIRLTMP